VALAEVPPDPDMCVHLCPDAEPGFLAAGVAAVAEAVTRDPCDACAAAAELVEALAMVIPKASVAPSVAAPTAVPMRGLVILTWYSFRVAGPPARGGSGQPPASVGQAHLTGFCAELLSPR
jgi:hypothetical protein